MVPSYTGTTRRRPSAAPKPARNDFIQAEYRPGTRQFNQRVASVRAAARPKPAAPTVYTSNIPTSTGITGSQARQATSVPQVYRGAADSGAQSRDAYARAMSQMGANQQANTLDQYRQGYQAQGEAARSADILRQRQMDLDRYGFGIDTRRATRQQDQQHSRNLREIANFRRNAAKGFQSSLAQASLGAIFGGNLLENLLVPGGRAYAGGARPFGGGGLMGAMSARPGGLFGGLLGR